MTVRLLRLAALMALLALAVSAAPLCTQYETLAQYIALGSGGCQIADKLFYNFTYSSSASSGTGSGVVAPTSAQITVTPDSSDQSQPGMTFTSSGWYVNGSATFTKPLFIDSTISFSVKTLDGAALIVGTLLSDAGQGNVVITGSGIVQVGETVTLPGGNSLTMGVTTNAPALYTDTDAFAAVSSLTVRKDLLVTVPRPNPGQTNTGSARVYSFTEKFSELPEPASMVLFGTGLLGLGVFRRRR